MAVRKEAEGGDSPGPWAGEVMGSTQAVGNKLEKGCYDSKNRVDGREEEEMALHRAEELAK